ncbi:MULTISPECIES: DUF4192 domain-containing protein [Corynebacterium]|uniref:DUF4192 domain-containing protein n=1 Tax=Corynebacterium TaxID=1716 RepID=UPI000981232F|nr:MULTISPECIES: DUF4192 domain-containing protein [Corynebacterium]MBF9011070.1 DUF4192 domain-containing protein [Corynebacterium phoceense]
MTTSHDAVTPGYLLASIPGALGFYPSDSIILMGFSSEDNRLVLGPVARFDIALASRQLPEAFAVVAAGADVVFAFIVSHRPDPAIHDLTDLLFDFSADLDDTDRTVDACWFTPEISVGQPYEMCFAPAEIPLTHTAEWQQGTIGSIAASPTMERWREAGRLPEISRDEAFACFDEANPHFGPRDIAAMVRAAASDAPLLAQGRPARPVPMAAGGAASTVAEDVRLRFEVRDIVPLATRVFSELSNMTGEPPEDDPVRADAVLLTRMATILYDTALRDLIVSALCDQPKGAARVLLAVAQTVHGLARTNALALYAMAQVALGLPMVAGTVLSVALEEDPEHTLAGLLMRGYRAGLQDKMVANFRRGSAKARASLGLDEDGERALCA